jgi:hypothetical protein
LDELKKLSPKDKLVKLKEIEKKNKEEIELARKMMDESEREVEIEEEFKRVPIPEAKAVDIDQLFSAEVKEIFKAKRFVEDKKRVEEEPEKPKERGLEETVREEARQVTRQDAQVQYGLALEEIRNRAKIFSESYNTIKSLTEKKREGEYLSMEEQNRLDSYGEMGKSLYEQKFMPEGNADKERMLAAEKMLYDSRLR